MKIKLFAGVMLAILSVSTFMLALNIEPVEASGTIYIRADGSVEGTTHITSVDSITYNFTDNIYDEIVVERSNIVVDGKGYTLEGPGSGVGFELVGISNVTIKNTKIKSFDFGVFLYSSSSNNTVSGNTITNNSYGIWLSVSCNNNTVSGNTITKSISYGGILISSSNYNTVSGNTITNNTYGVNLVQYSSNNTVSSNTITNNTSHGIWLSVSSNYNTFSGNTITNSATGVYLWTSSNNTFYHNNFIDNTQQAYIATPAGYANHWNSSYPSGGNYWSNYAGVDGDGDGIGDTPHVLDASNQDNYPYMNEDGWVRVRNIDTALGYWAIQEAIDAFETLDGHTIQVDPGTYVENVDVTKQLNIVGAGAEVTTVEASDPSDHVFYVSANNVNMSGFTVKDATDALSGGKAGVYLYSSNYSKIENINATNNRHGVYLDSSCHYNTVSGNTITDSTYGVHLIWSSNNNTFSSNTITNSICGVRFYESCNNNIVSGNTITNNTWYGVYLSSSSNNTVSGNTITDSTEYGVYLFPSCHYNVVSGNTITNSTTGVYLWNSCNNNTVSSNTITNNTDSGVYLYSSDNNTVSGNTITNSTHGFAIALSSNNTFSGNTITNNTAGVGLSLSSDNKFYHNNFIDNTQQVYIITPGYANHWNSSYPSGGNYWSNYTGVDGDGDGIGDTPHVLDAWNQDNYPFMNPWGPVHNINTTLHYWAIQEAIAAIETLDGHTIQVDPGIYVENVDVTKQLNITGAGAEVTTVEASNPNDHVFYVTASNVNMSGFTVKDADGVGAGVYLYYSNYSKIENISVSNNYFGIRLFHSSNNTVSSNNITYNTHTGVFLYSYSSNNTFSGNTITNSTTGVFLSSYSSNNTVSGNTITNNTNNGVYLYWSYNNTVSGNTITNNTNYGVSLSLSSDNTFYHNDFVDNAQHVYIEAPGYANQWNSSYPTSGNYWSNYTGEDRKSGPRQNDPGSDGMGDTPHRLDNWNQDNYPYMNRDRSIQIPDPVGGQRDIIITSNGTVTHVVANPNNLHFKTTGIPGQTYYVNVTIPGELDPYEIEVFLDGKPLEDQWPVITTNGTHHFIYFEFTASTHDVIIIYGPDWWPMFRHDLSHTGYSISMAPNTNNTIWKYTGLTVSSSPAVSDDKVYIGISNKVYCLNASTKELIWNYPTGSGVYSSPAVADGRVYVGSLDKRLYCLNASTGALIWNYTTDGPVESSPAVAYGKVYVGSHDGKVYCLNASTKELIWNYTAGFSVVSSPAVVDGKVYIGAIGGPYHNVYCLNASDGTKLWNYTTGYSVWSSPAVAKGKVYIGSYDDKVYCLNASDGTHIWNYTTDGPVESSPAVAYGKVYVGSHDGKVYCLNASTKELIWNYTTDDWVYSSPAVADGKVYVGSLDNKIYCLNASTGTEIWNYITSGSVLSSPAVADGKLFVGSMDGKVYAFQDIRDVAITHIAPSKTIVGQGRSVSIDVTVENQGNLTETFDVTAHYGNVTITPEQWDTFWNMGDVNKDGYINMTDYNLIAAHFGTSDPQYDIDESGLVDVMDLTICGFNQGLDIWTHFLIGRLIGEQTVYDLPAGSQSTLTFTWNTAGVPYNNWTITATAATLKGETDTADNTRTCWVVVTVSGDVNGDYVVDGPDLSDLNQAYGSTPGKPNWDPNCDLNDDDKVDASDLFELSQNYGKTA